MPYGFNTNPTYAVTNQQNVCRKRRSKKGSVLPNDSLPPQVTDVPMIASGPTISSGPNRFQRISPPDTPCYEPAGYPTPSHMYRQSGTTGGNSKVSLFLPSYAPGQFVYAKYEGKWYIATVQRVNKHSISVFYDGFGEQGEVGFDGIMSHEEMQRSLYTPGQSVYADYKGNWVLATVERVNEYSISVRYDVFGERREVGFRGIMSHEELQRQIHHQKLIQLLGCWPTASIVPESQAALRLKTDESSECVRSGLYRKQQEDYIDNNLQISGSDNFLSEEKDKKDIVPEVIEDIQRIWPGEVKNLKDDNQDQDFRSAKTVQIRFKNKEQLLRCTEFNDALFTDYSRLINKVGIAASVRNQKNGQVLKVGIIMQYVLQDADHLGEFHQCFRELRQKVFGQSWFPKQCSDDHYQKEGVLNMWSWNTGVIKWDKFPDNFRSEEQESNKAGRKSI